MKDLMKLVEESHNGTEVYSIDGYNESTAGADASVEASYNVASKKKPGDRSSDSLAVAS